ncbi:MAG TPA: response regulator transcription factor [Thermomicrobiaceae bacterium]|nr:response regulator transcription factor [Thermomicrobiaceae bacterium]
MSALLSGAGMPGRREVPATTCLRVLIVDDHAVVREGTRQLLAQDPCLLVVGEAGRGDEAVRLAATLRPDVVLLDLALPDRSGIEVARAIRGIAPDTLVVILSAYDDDDYVLAAMEVGASGYLLKTVRGREVIDAIHAVAEGHMVLHPTVAGKLRRLPRHGAEVAALSTREHEILRLATAGLHNKEIARELGISTRTVEAHLSHILTKLGVSSRTEAVLYGVSHHWFTPDGRPYAVR